MRIIMLFLLNIGFITIIAFGNPKANYVDNSSWNNLLNTYVTIDGKVDYNGFRKDKTQLDTYLQLLSNNVPDDSWSENEKLAFWINAYNAFTVSLIVEHYPVKSIMDIKNAWDIKFIQLGEQIYTLNEIEHKVIRKEFNEPRIHFVLVCAAVSCPVLLNEAYIADELERQLQLQGEHFINDSFKNLIKTNKAKVSQLFNWYGDDFTKKGNLIDYLNQFSTIQIDQNATIDFLEYNWDLNE